MVVIGVPNMQALNRVLAKLKNNNIVHYAWSEPDFEYGLTAIATEPLDGEQRNVLQNYRVWSEKNVGGTASTQQFAGLLPDSDANYPVTQL